VVILTNMLNDHCQAARPANRDEARTVSNLGFGSNRGFDEVASSNAAFNDPAGGHGRAGRGR
jgi:hypothetical protein